MRAFTDYPIAYFGDIPGEKAPIREVSVFAYDRNKYCWVTFVNEKPKTSYAHRAEEIKWSYLYTKPGRQGEVPCIDPIEI